MRIQLFRHTLIFHTVHTHANAISYSGGTFAN